MKDGVIDVKMSTVAVELNCSVSGDEAVGFYSPLLNELIHRNGKHCSRSSMPEFRSRAMGFDWWNRTFKWPVLDKGHLLLPSQQHSTLAQHLRGHQKPAERQMASS